MQFAALPPTYLLRHVPSPQSTFLILSIRYVQAYVPSGHGMVYMASIALARSRLFITYTRTIATTVIVQCGAWWI